MTETQRRRLLSELSARMPYGVKVEGAWGNDGPCELSSMDFTHNVQVRVFEDWFNIDDIKVYLRPMSSMTEEEKEYIERCMRIATDENYGDYWSPACWYAMTNFTKFCYERHLDYGGFIQEGIARVAPEGMYKTE